MVAQVARRYEGKVALIGIGSRDDDSELERFVDKYDLAFPNVSDISGGLRQRLGVVGQPSWIFVNADGTSQKAFGELGDAGLTERIEALGP